VGALRELHWRAMPRMGLRHRRVMPNGGDRAFGRMKDQQLLAGRPMILRQGPQLFDPMHRRQALSLHLIFDNGTFSEHGTFDHRLDQCVAKGHSCSQLQFAKGFLRYVTRGREQHPIGADPACLASAPSALNEGVPTDKIQASEGPEGGARLRGWHVPPLSTSSRPPRPRPAD
jgi:hypothetical protein